MPFETGQYCWVLSHLMAHLVGQCDHTVSLFQKDYISHCPFSYIDNLTDSLQENIRGRDITSSCPAVKVGVLSPQITLSPCAGILKAMGARWPNYKVEEGCPIHVGLGESMK